MGSIPTLTHLADAPEAVKRELFTWAGRELSALNNQRSRIAVAGFDSLSCNLCGVITNITYGRNVRPLPNDFDYHVYRLNGRSMNNVSWRFMRTCQECGHKQSDKDPKGAPTEAFSNRKCKRCGSEALDYGSEKRFNGLTQENAPEEDE